VAAWAGDDPATTTAAPDAGTPDRGAVDAATPDATTGSCAGQPFGPAQRVTFDSDAGSKTLFLDLRVVGTNAYFARSGLDSDAVPIYLYAGTFTPGAAPIVTGATSI